MTETELEATIQQVMGDINHDMNMMFPDRESFFGKRRTKKRLKLISKILPALPSVLDSNETIIYVTQGNSASTFEQLFAGGLASYYGNITTVVFTERRMIMFNTNRKGKQKLYRTFIPYNQIKKANFKRWFASIVKLKDRKKILISRIPRKDKKCIQQYVGELMAKSEHVMPSTTKSQQYLCPHCSFTVPDIVKSCITCGTQFKSPSKAALMSLFLPGLGDMYLGHYVFGVFELFGTLLLWSIMIPIMIAFANGEPEALGGLIMMSVIIGFTNVIDYFLTLMMGKKGLIAASTPTKAEGELYLG